jgi:hypothetical protein
MPAHVICEMVGDEAFKMPQTKVDMLPPVLSMGMLETEEFPMSPNTITREKDTDARKVMRNEKNQRSLINRSQ